MVFFNGYWIIVLLLTRAQRNFKQAAHKEIAELKNKITGEPIKYTLYPTSGAKAKLFVRDMLPNFFKRDNNANS